MTLKNCLEIGIDCGLQIISEAILNIEIHAISIFPYSELNAELTQLYREKEELLSQSKFSEDSKIEKVLEWLNNNIEIDKMAVMEARKV